MKQIIVFVLPERLLKTHATGTALDVFMRAAGGATIQDGHGVWYPYKDAAPDVEPVLSIRFACGDQWGYNTWELMTKDVCRAAILEDGEKAVYVETLSPRGTLWNIYKREDLQ